LQLDLFPVDCYHPSAKFNANCEIMDWLEAFVSELQEQARFSDSCDVAVNGKEKEKINQFYALSNGSAWEYMGR